MKLKSVFRSPLIWILFAVMALLIGSNAATGSSASEKVDTWKIVDDIQQGRA